MKIKSYKERIRNKNKQYNDADDNGKKVIICQEALKLIKLNKIDASSNYFDYEYYSWMEKDASLKECIISTIEDDGPICTVCAIGATFISSVALFNNVKSDFEDPIGESNFQVNFITKETPFTENELSIMELAYEGSLHVGEELLIEYSDPYIVIADSFSELYSTERLKAILQAIIDCNGDVCKALYKGASDEELNELRSIIYPS